MKNINEVTERIKRNAANGREPLRTIISQSQNPQVIEIAGLASMYLDYISECMTVIDCLTEMLQRPAQKRIFVVDASPVDIRLLRELETSGNVVVCCTDKAQPELPTMPALPIVPLKILHHSIPAKPGQVQRRERRKRERKIKNQNNANIH